MEVSNNKQKVLKVIELVKGVMQQVPIEWLKPEIPFPVEVKCGFKWGEMKEVK
jgi:hypothetical protein